MGYFPTDFLNYDSDGNMTSGPLPGVDAFVSYTYDARNRLISVSGTSYQYDAESNRIGKTDTNGTTSYVIDPHGDALPRVLIRENPDLSAGQAGGSITRYVYGIGLLYQVDDNDTATYYHYDQSGSTIALSNTSGAVTDRVEYSPFGTITHRTGSTDTPFLYAGQFGIQQESNGLLHMRARYYSPELRRFLNADPIGFDGGLNWYAYADGNPVMHVDPDGEHPIVALALAGTAAYLGSTQFANAPGPNDPTFNGAPFADEALVAGAVGPAIAVGRTIVGSSMTAGRGFINTLTGPATSAAVRDAGTMGFAEATAATGTLATRAAAGASNLTLSASQNFGSRATAAYGTYSAVTFAGGTIAGALTPLEPSDATISINPLALPYQAGNLYGGLLAESFSFSNPQPVSNPPASGFFFGTGNLSGNTSSGLGYK
jgi:RHS repeat-associated protein